MEKKEKSLYERAKFVQGDIFEIAKSLRFIKLAVENDDLNEARSSYNRHLVWDMLERMAFFTDNMANEVFRNLKIKEPEKATGGEV